MHRVLSYEWSSADVVAVGSGTLTLEEQNNGSQMLVVAMNIIIRMHRVLSCGWSSADVVAVGSGTLTLEEQNNGSQMLVVAMNIITHAQGFVVWVVICGCGCGRKWHTYT